MAAGGQPPHGEGGTAKGGNLVRLPHFAAVARHCVHFAAQVVAEHLSAFLVLGGPGLQCLPRSLVTYQWQSATRQARAPVLASACHAQCTTRHRCCSSSYARAAATAPAPRRVTWPCRRGGRGAKVLPAQGRGEGQRSAVKQGCGRTCCCPLACRRNAAHACLEKGLMQGQVQSSPMPGDSLAESPMQRQDRRRGGKKRQDTHTATTSQIPGKHTTHSPRGGSSSGEGLGSGEGAAAARQQATSTISRSFSR